MSVSTFLSFRSTRFSMPCFPFAKIDRNVVSSQRLLHCNIIYIYISILLNTYWVKFEIIVMVFVSYKCTNGNILIFIRALWPTAGNGPQRKFGGSWDCHFKVQSVILLPVANLSEFILICNVLVMIKQQKILPLCQRSLFYLLFCWSQWQFKVLEHFIFPLVSKDSCETQWPRPPLFSLSWLIKWSMGGGFLYNLVSHRVTSLRFTE